MVDKVGKEEINDPENMKIVTGTNGEPSFSPSNAYRAAVAAVYHNNPEEEIPTEDVPDRVAEEFGLEETPLSEVNKFVYRLCERGAVEEVSDPDGEGDWAYTWSGKNPESDCFADILVGKGEAVSAGNDKSSSYHF